MYRSGVAHDEPANGIEHVDLKDTSQLAALGGHREGRTDFLPAAEIPGAIADERVEGDRESVWTHSDPFSCTRDSRAGSPARRTRCLSASRRR